MSSKKMNQRSQIKRGKTKRSEDKMDKAMSDIKKIGIISCCLVAVLLVVGIFVNPKESYAADFLTQVPEQFTSVMSTGEGNYQMLIEGNVYVDEANPSVNNYIQLPKNFSGQEADGTFISYIYCMDRRMAMESGKLYVKGNSVKIQNDIAPERNGIEELDVTADYPGLIYILQNHERLGGNAEQNYYYTQIAVWWYVDRANGLSDGKNYKKEDGTIDDTIETSYEYKYEKNEYGELTDYKFLNNLSVLDKQMLNNNSIGKSIEQLVTEAEHNEGLYPIDQGSHDITIDQNNITYTVTNDYVETSLIRPVSSNANFESYAVIINNAAGNVEVVDENNNLLDTSSISSTQAFKLRIPIDQLNNQTFRANITVIAYFKDWYDAYIYNPPEESGLQRALLGRIEKNSTPTTLDLEAPSINVPDTNSTSYIVYGIGALIIIAGIVLIVMAKGPKNAKKK